MSKTRLDMDLWISIEEDNLNLLYQSFIDLDYSEKNSSEAIDYLKELRNKNKLK
jgi:hypothetical protein